jgi:hypothetical protein
MTIEADDIMSVDRYELDMLCGKVGNGPETARERCGCGMIYSGGGIVWWRLRGTRTHDWLACRGTGVKV